MSFCAFDVSSGAGRFSDRMMMLTFILIVQVFVGAGSLVLDAALGRTLIQILLISARAALVAALGARTLIALRVRTAVALVMHVAVHSTLLTLPIRRDVVEVIDFTDECLVLRLRPVARFEARRIAELIAAHVDGQRTLVAGATRERCRRDGQIFATEIAACRHDHGIRYAARVQVEHDVTDGTEILTVRSTNVHSNEVARAIQVHVRTGRSTG